MSLVQVHVQMPDLLAKFKKNEKRIYDMIAATMQTQRGMIFDHEGAYNGRQKWKPLHPAGRQGMILSDKGTLRKSIGPRNDGKRPRIENGGIVRFVGDTVQVGTNLFYAAIHNYGGIITPKNRKFLKYKMGRKTVFSKKSVIPARPFADLTPEDEAEIQETITNFIAEVFNS